MHSSVFLTSGTAAVPQVGMVRNTSKSMRRCTRRCGNMRTIFALRSHCTVPFGHSFGNSWKTCQNFHVSPKIMRWSRPWLTCYLSRNVTSIFFYRYLWFNVKYELTIVASVCIWPHSGTVRYIIDVCTELKKSKLFDYSKTRVITL